MQNCNVFFFSPFSHERASNGNNRSLVLQFILSELLASFEEMQKPTPAKVLTLDPCFFPFDWAKETGSLNRMKEHLRLLPYAFPQFADSLQGFKRDFESKCRQLLLEKKINKKDTLAFLHECYDALMPFLLECKNDGTLILYLLKNHTRAQKLGLTFPILEKNEHKHIKDLVIKQYEKRGFKFLVPRINLLIEEWEKSYA